MYACIIYYLCNAIYNYHVFVHMAHMAHSIDVIFTYAVFEPRRRRSAARRLRYH